MNSQRFMRRLSWMLAITATLIIITSRADAAAISLQTHYFNSDPFAVFSAG